MVLFLLNRLKKVFEPMMTENKDPEKIIEEKGMKQISDPNALKNYGE